MKENNEKLLDKEIYLLRKLNSIKNIKYSKDLGDKLESQHDLTLLYKNDEIEIRFELFLDYKHRQNIKYEITNNKTIEKPNEFIQNFINSFEWKDGISLMDFFIKFEKDLNEYVLRLINIKNASIESLTTNEENVSEFFLKSKYFYQITFLIHMISIFLKLTTGLYGYSGETDRPKFGDYEAQRHWMELTFNLNITDWYTNSTNNPDNYWPMDYPPVSGYYSLIWGHFFNLTIPTSINLKDSWGYESPLHKSLMRLSVIISDIIFYHIPVVMLLNSIFQSQKNRKNYISYYISSFLFLCSPLLIIIDHGHFQYNCVMHGMFLLAVYFLYNKNFILAICFYAICINFKQMGFYFALPFPFYVIKYLVDQSKNYSNKFARYGILILSVLKYAIYSGLIMLLIWGPWIMNENKYKDVLSRIFPIWRGIFEDKVATFWCTLSIVYKIKNFSHDKLVLSSLSLTLFFSLVSCVGILFYKKASRKITNLAFFNVAMSFFLFSFHVHEKTILIPFLAYLLIFNTIPEILSSFTLISLFSLHPLLKRENQTIPYFVFLIFSFLSTKYFTVYLIEKKEDDKTNKIIYYIRKLCFFIDIMNVLAIIIYHYMEYAIPPPEKYQWLYPTVNAAYSFFNFSFYFFLSNLKLLELLMSSKRKKVDDAHKH